MPTTAPDLGWAGPDFAHLIGHEFTDGVWTWTFYPDQTRNHRVKVIARTGSREAKTLRSIHRGNLDVAQAEEWRP